MRMTSTSRGVKSNSRLSLMAIKLDLQVFHPAGKFRVSDSGGNH
jgi:hypothetical protein